MTIESCIKVHSILKWIYLKLLHIENAIIRKKGINFY